MIYCIERDKDITNELSLHSCRESSAAQRHNGSRLVKQCHPIPECSAAALCKRLFYSILSSTSARSNCASCLRVKSAGIWWGGNGRWGEKRHSGLLRHQAPTPGHGQDAMTIFGAWRKYWWMSGSAKEAGGGVIYLIVRHERPSQKECFENPKIHRKHLKYLSSSSVCEDVPANDRRPPSLHQLSFLMPICHVSSPLCRPPSSWSRAPTVSDSS